MSEPAPLTRTEVAAKYSITPATVDKWAQTGAMPPARRLGAGVLRWAEADLIEWESTPYCQRLLLAGTEIRSEPG